MNITIREAQPEDAESLIAYVQALTEEEDIDIGLSPGEFQMTEQQERQFILDVAAEGNSIMLLALAGGEIVGQLTLKGRPRRAVRHSTVLSMSVKKGWRSRGIGNCLMQAAVAYARECGAIRRIELFVFARNAGAIHLYEKFGFQVEGRRRGAIYRNGTYLDDLLMALWIEP